MCQVAGRRARQLKQVVNSLLAQIRNLATSYAADHPWVDLHNFGETLVACTNALGGIVHLKFRFLSELPYLIVGLRDPAVSAGCLQRRDALCAAGGLLHRVTEGFLSPHSPLRPHVEANAQGLGVSETFSKALQPYEGLKVDEAFVEGQHNEATKERQRSHGAGGPYVQATLGLGEASAVVDAARKNRAAAALLQKCWKAYKLLAAPYAHHVYPYRVPKPTRKLQFKEVVERVYRVGSFSLVDHSVLKRFFSEKGKPTALPVSAADDQHLAFGYVSAVLQNGQVYALPVADALPVDDLALRPFDTDQPQQIVAAQDTPMPDNVYFLDFLTKPLINLKQLPPIAWTASP